MGALVNLEHLGIVFCCILYDIVPIVRAILWVAIMMKRTLREHLHALTCSPPSLPPTSPNYLDRTQKGNVESPILLHLIIYRTVLRSTIQCYIEQPKPRIQALIACADAWSPSNFVSDTFQWHWSQLGQK